MKPNRQNLFSPKTILGISVGIISSISLIALLKNYILASILGMLIAVIIAGLRQTRDLTLLGLITGSIAGLFWGARNYLISDQVQQNLFDLNLLFAMLGGLVLTGLLCAGYGFVISKLLPLYKRGQGPFF